MPEPKSNLTKEILITDITNLHIANSSPCPNNKCNYFLKTDIPSPLIGISSESFPIFRNFIQAISSPASEQIPLSFLLVHLSNNETKRCSTYEFPVSEYQAYFNLIETKPFFSKPPSSVYLSHLGELPLFACFNSVKTRITGLLFKPLAFKRFIAAHQWFLPPILNTLNLLQGFSLSEIFQTLPIYQSLWDLFQKADEYFQQENYVLVFENCIIPIKKLILKLYNHIFLPLEKEDENYSTFTKPKLEAVLHHLTKNFDYFDLAGILNKIILHFTELRNHFKPISNKFDYVNYQQHFFDLSKQQKIIYTSLTINLAKTIFSTLLVVSKFRSFNP